MDKYERFELEQKQRESPRNPKLTEWMEEVKTLGAIAGIVFMFAVYFGVALAVLYWIVRFVKWAWSD